MPLRLRHHQAIHIRRIPSPNPDKLDLITPLLQLRVQHTTRRIAASMRQKRQPLHLPIHGNICNPLPLIAIEMLNPNTRHACNIRLHVAEHDSPRAGAANVSRRLAGGTGGACDSAGAGAEGGGFAFVLGFGGAGGCGARARVDKPVYLVFQGGGGAGDGEREPHVRAAHEVGADPAVAHVHEGVADGEDEGGLRGVGVGAAVGEFLPAGPWAGEGGSGAVVVVVGVPAAELRGEHEVDAVLLDDGGGFVLLGESVRVRDYA